MPNFEGKPEAPRTIDDVLEDISNLKKQIDLKPDEMETKKQILLDEAKKIQGIDIDKIIGEIPEKDFSLEQDDVEKDLDAIAEARLLPKKDLETLLLETNPNRAYYWRSILNSIQHEGLIGLERLREQVEKDEDGEIKFIILAKITKRLDDIANDKTETEKPKPEKIKSKKVDEFSDMEISAENKELGRVMLRYIYRTDNPILLKQLRDKLKKEKKINEKVRIFIIEKIDEILEDMKIIDAYVDKGDGEEWGKNLDLIDNPDLLRTLIKRVEKNGILTDEVKESLLIRLHALLDKAENNE